MDVAMPHQHWSDAWSNVFKLGERPLTRRQCRASGGRTLALQRVRVGAHAGGDLPRHKVVHDEVPVAPDTLLPCSRALLCLEGAFSTSS